MGRCVSERVRSARVVMCGGELIEESSSQRFVRTYWLATFNFAHPALRHALATYSSTPWDTQQVTWHDDGTWSAVYAPLELGGRRKRGLHKTYLLGSFVGISNG